MTTCIHNVLSGPRWIEHYGEVLIRNTRDASYHCKITFCKVRPAPPCPALPRLHLSQPTPWPLAPPQPRPLVPGLCPSHSSTLPSALDSALHGIIVAWPHPFRCGHAPLTHMLT